MSKLVLRDVETVVIEVPYEPSNSRPLATAVVEVQVGRWTYRYKIKGRLTRSVTPCESAG